VPSGVARGARSNSAFSFSAATERTCRTTEEGSSGPGPQVLMLQLADGRRCCTQPFDQDPLGQLTYESHPVIAVATSHEMGDRSTGITMQR
jgi:hypothetical protein